MNKRITIKKIMLMLYALLMCLPLISVGFRSLYVTFNENAKDSYSGLTELIYYDKEVVSNTNEVNYPSDIVVNNIYYFNNKSVNCGLWFQLDDEWGFDFTLTLQVIDGTITYNNQSLSYTELNNVNNDIRVIFPHCYQYYIKVGDLEIEIDTELDEIYFNGNFKVLSFVLNTFNNQDNDYLDLLTMFWSSLKPTISTYETYVEKTLVQSNLDNAFDYSLHEFIENNNTGLINFVGLFSDMFLGNSNVENGLYLGFANFMMNYALFISCAYFVFEVLMWFINYARKWLYAFEEKGGAE